MRRINTTPISFSLYQEHLDYFFAAKITDDFNQKLDKIFDSVSEPINLAVMKDVFTFPTEYPESLVERLTDPDKINKLFVKNKIHDLDLPNVEFLPLGLDLHTMNHRGMFYGDRISIPDQVKKLDSIFCTHSKPISEREFKIAISFPLERNNSTDRRIEKLSKMFDEKFLTREEISNYLNEDPSNRPGVEPTEPIKSFLRIPETTDRDKSWELMSSCMFTLSPLGAGFDCHRTWEALLLGGITIIPKSPVSQNLVDAGLPVVVIHDVEDINPDNMSKWLVDCKDKVDSKATMRYLSSEYWVNLINQSGA